MTCARLEQLDAALSHDAPAGNTALYDGIALALEHLRAGTRGRKALIVVSDGEDNSSQLRLPELMKRVEASSVTIHTIGLANPGQTDKNLAVLKRLARATGGAAYFPRSVSEVTEVCQEIARDIRHQYTLGYTPTGNDATDRYHAIRVTAKAKGMSGLRVHTRAGYLPS